MDPAVTTAAEVSALVARDALPALSRRYPGLSYRFAGEQEDLQESLAALRQGMSIAFVAMLVLLAVVFRSYVLPLLVVLAVPFGLVGALSVLVGETHLRYRQFVPDPGGLIRRFAAPLSRIEPVLP